MLAFAPNGRLYFTMGDGGAGGDPENRSQNMRSLFGKLLSINVATKGLKIEALGLRNAWRFSFDRANGDLYIGDVGQGDVEEIDYTPAASPGLENYGWDVYEGRSKFEDKPLGAGKLVMPVAQYRHDDGCSVTGGYVYRGSNASLRGRYIYGDYCSGNIWSFKTRRRQGDRVAPRALQDRQRHLLRAGHRGRALRRLAWRHDLPPDALRPICLTCATHYAPARRRASRVRSASTSASTSASAASSGRRSRSCAERHVRHPRGLRLPRDRSHAAAAIGQRFLLAESPEGNVLWDMIPLVDDAAVEAVRARGEVRAIAISHPHYYSGMVEWSEALGGVPILLHEADREWIMRPDPRSSSGRATRRSSGGGLTLLRLGGHYPGGTVLHDASTSTLLSATS